MRIFLLGANGQLGHDIMRAVEGSKLDVVPWRRDDLDLTDPKHRGWATLRALHWGALINCTGFHKTDAVEDDAATAVQVNAHAVKTLAEIADIKGAKFVHVSTDYVFGGDLTRRIPYAETAPTAPINVYGASKALGENFVRAVGDNHVIARVASLFGVAGASGKGGNFVETMIKLAKERPIKVVDDQIMSPTSTYDAARAILYLTASDHAKGTYHVSNYGWASWYEFAEEILKGRDADLSPCATQDMPTRAMRPAYSVFNTSKLHLDGYEMPYWKVALDRYLKEKGYR